MGSKVADLLSSLSRPYQSIFSERFNGKYKVFDAGILLNGEWGWVLIGPKESSTLKVEGNIPKTYNASFTESFVKKELFFSNCQELIGL